MKKISVNRKNTLLTQRVSKLLESKSNTFKRKFELISLLSEMKLSNDNMSKLECYANTLIESSGVKPDVVSLKNYVSNIMRENRVYNKDSVMLTVENFLNLKYKNSLNESLVEEELDNINCENLQLNNKLYETLIYSIENNKPIFFESSSDDDWRNNVVDAADILGIADKVAKKEVQQQSPETVVRSSSNRSKGLRGLTARKINQEVDQMEPEVLRIIREQPNNVIRKFYLFFSIHYFLRVQRILTPPGLDVKVDKFSDQSTYSSMKSGLSIDEIEELESKWDALLDRGTGRLEEDLANEKLFPEAELLSLLRKSAGDDPEQKLLVDDVIESLNNEFPDGDEDVEEYEVDADVLSMSDEEAEKYEKELLDKDKEWDEELEAHNKEIGGMTTSKFNNIIRGKSSLTNIEADQLNSEQIKILNDTFTPEVVADMISNLDQRRQEELGLKIIINCDDLKKSSVYRELMQKSASPEEFEAYVKDFFGADVMDKPQSYADIARISGGDFTGSAGARQEIMKIWFKTLFLSSDDEAKAEIYANLGDRWFEALRLLDLVEDETVNIPGVKSMKGTKLIDYFEKVESIVTNRRNVLSYLDGSMESSLAQEIDSFVQDSPDNVIDEEELETLKILDVLLTNNTSFRIFSSKILDKFYHESIWNMTEKELAQAIKEYFNKNFPSAKIDASGKLTQGKVSGVIAKEEGRALFNPIIYWVMGRTGIKDKESKVSDASTMTSQRIDYFRKKFPKVLEKYNSDDADVKLVMTRDDIEDLIDDMLSDSGIIGGVLKDKRKLDSNQVSEVVDWISSIPTNKIEAFLSDSLLYAEKYRSVLEDNGLFNKQLEDKIKIVSSKILGDYTKAYKADLKKHSEYTSDEFGYSRK